MKYRPKAAVPGRTVHPLALVFGAVVNHLASDVAKKTQGAADGCGCAFRPFMPVEELPERPPVVVEEPVRARRTYRSRERVA